MDIQLINRCLKKERAAQNELYRKLLPYLNLVCQRYLYEKDQRQDILQETFIRIFRNLDRFEAQQASFKTWATKIAINCCLTHNAKSEKRLDQELVLPSYDQSINPKVLQKLSNEDILRWLKKMPEPLFAVFNLYTVDGFSHREIAAILEISVALSRQRLTRSRAWLKQRLPEEYRSQFGAQVK